MPLYSFEGPQGTGKTMSAVAMAYEENKVHGRKVVSNNHLNFEYTHFDIAYFLDNVATHELENCVLLLDEAYQYIDARMSQSKLNKLFTYFIVQTRKRDVDMYICTHHIDHLDKRLRRAIDCRGIASYQEEKPCKKCKGSGTWGRNGSKPEKCPRCLGYGIYGASIMRFRWVRRRGRGRRFDVNIPGPYYWHLYSTKERMPIQSSAFEGIDTLEIV